MTDKPSMADIFELRSAIDQRDRQIEKLKGDLENANRELAATAKKLKSARLLNIADAARMVGVRDASVVDIIGRAEAAGSWDVDHRGKLRRKNEQGILDEDVYEWLRKIKADSPFHFEDSALTEGLSGKPNASRKSITIEDKTYSPEEIRKIFKPKEQGGNFTKASLIYKQDPELAASVAEEVGNKIFARIEAQDRKFGR